MTAAPKEGWSMYASPVTRTMSGRLFGGHYGMGIPMHDWDTAVGPERAHRAENRSGYHLCEPPELADTSGGNPLLRFSRSDTRVVRSADKSVRR